MITPADPSITGLIAALETRVRSLELGSSGVRPQLFVLGPLTSRTAGGRVPYSVVVKNVGGSWSGSPNYQWTVPVSGLYLVQAQSKVVSGTTGLVLKRSAGGGLFSAASSGVNWTGASLTGVQDIAAGETVWVEDANTFTPQNDTNASNYLMLTYLGRTTP